MGAESEINATTKYVQTKFYLHKNYGTIGSCSPNNIIRSHVH